MSTESNQKSIPQRLFVHMDGADKVHLVGELQFDLQVIGGFSAKFRYSDDWLKSEHSFSLDPINLPMSQGKEWVQTDNKLVKLGVIFDAGPDMWGRQVARHARKTSSVVSSADLAESELLHMGRGNGVGALLFSTRNNLKRSDLPGIKTLPSIEGDLERVHQAAHNVFSTDPLPDALQGLLAGSWSIGGARAKAVMRDAQNGLWICKFSEPGSSIDRQRVEYANMQMAKAIGLEVPECHLVQTALGSVLMIRRFDRTPELQRIHYASAISLVSAVPQDKRLSTAFDRRTFSYANLAHIVSVVSADPVHERMSLYARMALNVAVHNTDDHLKNFGFLAHVQNGQHRLRLAPVFDVVTQSSALHYLRIGTEERVGSLKNVLSEPRYFMLTDAGAKGIVDRVTQVVSRRHQFYEEADMAGADIDAMNSIIEKICPAVGRGDVDLLDSAFPVMRPGE
jgi:serine/threonine-protein kinase HipA